MKILLDNCVAYRAKQLFVGHDVSHAQDLRWTDLENSSLLAAAARSGFDVLVTVDKNLRHQQNLDRLPLSVLELHTSDIRLPAPKALATHFPAALAHVGEFRFVSVKGDGQIETLGPRRQPKGEGDPAPDR